MGPALQRLLSRPCSLEFLRYLVGTPLVPAKRTPRGNGRIYGRSHAGVAAAARGVGPYDDVEEDGRRPTVKSSPRAELAPKLLPPTDAEASFLPTQTSKAPLGIMALSKPSCTTEDTTKYWYSQWNESLWTFEHLEFESDLDMVTEEPGRTRLLDRNEYRDDLKLWAFLLEYRGKIYGPPGVLTFWNAVQRRNLHLPTKGLLAEKFWPKFLALGFQDHTLLDQVCGYADRILDDHRERWSRLYTYIIQHFLVSGQGEAAVKWHERLFELHPPGPKGFAEMCRQVTFKDGDMDALRIIYKRNTHRNAYSKVIPLLCEREDYKRALDWHFFFLGRGDVPSMSKVVEPLVRFLAIYDRTNALKVTRSLGDAGVSFALSISNDLDENTKISREVMNLIHGKTFNVSVKKYSDNLGARWFATKWVSLDVAIHAVHALGVQEIGPLSLQAIGLRDPDTKAVVLRINQLRQLGISIGNSLFSRAVEHFARNRKYDLLEGLLSSDQHPDQFEDHALQESLLASYARAKKWTQYRLTLEIRTLVSKSPATEKSNTVLRCYVTRGNTSAVMEMLADMETSRIPVTSKSIAHLIRYTLRPRQQGRRPMNIAGMRDRGAGNDLNMVIALLKRIMKSGGFVPILHWREILRRLGMIGRFEDLGKLSCFLASCYGPLGSSSRYRPRQFRLLTQVPTSHYLHPLKMLFNPALQKAIVEWGFIHSLKRGPMHLDSAWRSVTLCNKLPDITSGVVLLKQLSQYGVHIDATCVRSALFNRLITYYGPGRSNRRYNRYGKAVLEGKMDLVARQIDDALGGTFFTAVDLPKVVQAKAATRLRRLDRRWKNKLAARLSPASRLGIGVGSSR
jgi:pentatricopeptide repeat protein